ncbi:MAG: glycine cleavage system protein GcvH [Alphaproteobacteria bacterium]|nr:glycine cleavage system protein GcvH [Alphaproteobacteria bacterium]
MSEIKFTNEHECIKIDGDVAWIGITKYAQEALGDVVHVELPEVGKQLKKGDNLAVVESVKTAAEVYSPVDGEIIEANVDMENNLELVAQLVSEGGWIAKIKISDASQLEGLMDEVKYNEYTENLD